MYYDPYSLNSYGSYREANLPKSYTRVFNASPNAPALDVYANDSPIAQNLSYKQFSEYLLAPPGNYNIKVYPANEKTNPVLETTVYIPPNTIFNLAIIGDFPNISIYTIPEPVAKQNFGRPCIRFINLSPSSQPVDISLSDGTKVFNNVGYKDITNYACMPSGTYTFEVSSANTNSKLLTLPNIQLAPNNYYTIYAVGSPDKSIPLETILASEPR